MSPLTSSTDESILSKRRVYSPPSLKSYGLVTDLTQSGSGGSSEASFNSPAPNCEVNKKPHNSCPSDLRLKTNIRLMSVPVAGLGLYLFEYKSEFKTECGDGAYLGYMAQEVLALHPSAVVMRADGHYAIDYAILSQLLH